MKLRLNLCNKIIFHFKSSFFYIKKNIFFLNIQKMFSYKLVMVLFAILISKLSRICLALPLYNTTRLYNSTYYRDTYTTTNISTGANTVIKNLMHLFIILSSIFRRNYFILFRSLDFVHWKQTKSDFSPMTDFE